MNKTAVPEWMLRKEKYTSLPDRDSFVDKSILSIIRVISRIRTQEDQGGGFMTSINTSVKVLFTFILLVLVSLTRSFAFVLIINVYLLVILSTLDSGGLIQILKMGLVFTLFTAAVMLPAFLWGSHYSFILITSKVWATITAIGLVSHKSKWSEITASLAKFHIPNIFIFVLDITIKYIYLLGEFSLAMLYSLRLRSIGRNDHKYTSMAGIAGTLFLQSKEMAEDLYHAMECRGFSGEYPMTEKLRLTALDYAYIAMHIAFIAIFIYFGRIAK